jgi:hypothetical protein
MQTRSHMAKIALYGGLAVLAAVASFVSAGSKSQHGFSKPFRKEITADGTAKAVSGTEARPVAAAAYAKLPLRFEENQGQTAREVRFVSHGAGYELFLTPQEAVLALHPTRRLDLSPMHRTAYFRAQRDARKAQRTSVLRMRLANANPATKVAGMDPVPGRVDYFLGSDPANWRTNIRSYARVKYTDVYPGVDLVFYGNQRRLEYDFIVAPGGDPRAIAWNVEGARELRLNARGDLLVRASGGEVELQKPMVYQEIHGERREITGGYIIGRDHRVTFAVAKYDRAQPLIVDPVLVYSTYLGGELDDSASAIALDTRGDAVVAGTTLSLHFPTTTGAFTQSPLASNANGVVFVTVVDPTGSELLYSSYIGGTGGDAGFGVAVDLADRIYVTGETTSTDFPTTTNALKPGPNVGNVNGTSFVAKIDPNIVGAGSLVYSSYLGGTQGTVSEFGNGIAVDKNGVAYVVGFTASQPGTALANFPVTIASAFQTTPDASNTAGTAFLTKIDTTQSGNASLIYSTYLSGNGLNSASQGFGDAAFAVTEDSLGNTYLAGTTTSTNFPTTSTAFQQSAPAAIAGGTVFLSRFDTTKTGAASLLYSTYLGGDTADFGDAIALGPLNVAYVTGATNSLLFPTTSGAFQTTGNALGVAFVSLVDTGLTGSASLKYSTFLGGSHPNSGAGIAADVLGNAYVVGGTQATDFPVTKGAFQTSLASGAPGGGYVTKLNPGGLGAADLVYSTYFGGSGSSGAFDQVNAIALNLANNAFIAGDAVSPATSFPVFPNPGAFQATLNGPSDAFVAELTLQLTLTVSPGSLTFGPQLVGAPTAAKTVTLTNNTISAIAFTGVAVSGGAPAAANTDFTSPSNTCGTSIAPGASCTISVVFTPSVAAVETANLVITDSDSTSPQTVTLTGTSTNTPPGFSVTAPPSLAVAQGASGPFTVTVTPSGGFNQTVALACSGAPAGATCTIAPASVTLTDGTTAMTATATVATTRPSVVAPLSSTPRFPLAMWRVTSLLVALLSLFLLTRVRRSAVRLTMAAAMASFLILAGCGGGHKTPVPSGGTPKGTSTLTVTGTSGSLTSTATVSLTVN